MAGKISTHLAAMGIELPKASTPVANYVPVVLSGNQAYVSGQISMWNGEIKHLGRLGQSITIDQGQEAARLCALNIIAQLQASIGDLDRVVRCVKLNIFVNSAADFTDQPKVGNGASDLMVQVFGEAGKHARAAVGVAQLPFGVAVEVDGLFEFN